MAIAKLNPRLKSISGSIGGLTLRQYGSRTVISRKPVFENRSFSEAQKAAQEKFRQATLHAKRLMQDPRALETYRAEAGLTSMPILSLMIRDYLHAPQSDEHVVSLSDKSW